MTSRLKVYILLLSITLITSGCSNERTIFTNQGEAEATLHENESYPIITQTPNMQPFSYPVDESEEPFLEQITPTSGPLIIPEPNPNAGIITGILLSSTTNESLPHVKIYMAKKVPLEPGSGYVLSFQKETSPQTDTNGRGEFIIENIPPGEHMILFVTPFGSFPLFNDNAEQIEIDISTETIYELGKVFVNWP